MVRDARPDDHAHVLLMRTLSKFGLAGVRLGYMVGPQALVWYLHAEGELAEPGLFLSALDADRFEALCAQWDFDDLG